MSLDTYPVAYVEAMQARIAELERELEQARQDRARAAMDARNPLLARFSALEAEAKQAREDEEWALQCGPLLVTDDATWTAYLRDPKSGMHRNCSATTIAAAIRQLREKVEGGAR